MERDLLVKKVFPQLRKMCEERSVSWTEVDLRWGITSEQAAEGKVLPLCLEEIERCRPYFIGLLGERYGWVPISIPDELVQVQPWLREHLNCSVTELEILYGVFREEKTRAGAYFYFRSHNYLERLPEAERNEFEAESPNAVASLAKLKRKIREGRENSLYSLKESYAGPEELGEWILEDFTKLVDALYPKEDAPDELDQEAARHEAHARSRRLAFIGREDLIERLNEHAAGTTDPLVLTGESGCGKSALLAEWVGRWKESNPNDFVIQHYVGSTSNGADWPGVVRRIVGELKRGFDLEGDLPNDDDALRSALNKWAGKVAGPKRIVLVVDALNQVAHENSELELSWLPIFFPRNFRVVVSSLSGKSLDVLRKRQWSEIEVPLFRESEIGPAAIAYFSLFSKTPSSKMIQDLRSTPAARNPLFLRTVLDELRQFGRREELQIITEEYLSARGPAELFDLILTRWEHDFDQNEENPGLIRNALCLIACSRFGLSEVELLDLLGQGEQPMQRRYWTPFYLAAENALSQNAGLMRFGHDYLRRAVESRWLEASQTKKSYRLAIANYFSRREIVPRTAAELPWQLKQSEENDRLRNALVDLNLALAILDRFSSELLGYWVWLGEERSIGQTYVELVRSSPQNLKWSAETTSNVATRVADFLTEAAIYPQAEELYRYALSLEEESGAQPGLKTAAKLIKLSEVLLLTKRSLEGETKLLRAIDIIDAQTASETLVLVSALLNLTTAQEARGAIDEAENNCHRALQIAEDQRGSHDPLVATCLGQLGELLMMHSIRFTEFDLTLRSGRKELRRDKEAEPILRRSLAINEESRGPNDLQVAESLHRLSICLAYGDQLLEAERHITQAIPIAQNALGSRHPYLASLLITYAQILDQLNREDESAEYRNRSEKIREDIKADMSIVDTFSNIVPGYFDALKWAIVSSFSGRLALSLIRRSSRMTGRPRPRWIDDLSEYHRLDHVLTEKKKVWKKIAKRSSTGLSLAQLFIHLAVIFYAVIDAIKTTTLSTVLAVFFSFGMHVAGTGGVIIVDLYWAYRWWPSNFARFVSVVTVLFAAQTLIQKVIKKYS